MHESRDVLNEQIKISSNFVYLSETMSNSICLLRRYTFDSAEKKIMHINHAPTYYICVSVNSRVMLMAVDYRRISRSATLLWSFSRSLTSISSYVCGHGSEHSIEPPVLQRPDSTTTGCSEPWHSLYKLQFLRRRVTTLPFTSHLHFHEEVLGFRNFVRFRIFCWYTTKWAQFLNISK
jgi:hypothetical protein